MPASGSSTSQNLRNIGIMAHIDAGKTTTTERILYYSGKTHKMGEVHDGNTTMDWMVQEQERGITIQSAATRSSWRGTPINIIDTPGHVDFTIEVERALRVLDGAVAVFDAVHGVEAQSEKVWHQADKYKVPRLCFINKMDRTGASFKNSVHSIQKKLTLPPIAIQHPWFEGDNFVGVIDLIQQKALRWQHDDLGKTYTTTPVPEALQTEVSQAREKMLEQLADFDNDFMNDYLEARPIAPPRVHKILRHATLNLKCTPVLCGAAFKNIGVQTLLDAVVEYLPHPFEERAALLNTKPDNIDSVNTAPAHTEATDSPAAGTTKAGTTKAAAPPGLAVLAFKMVADNFAGLMAYVRVYSGRLKVGDSVYNSRTKKKEKIARLVRMHANSREEIKQLEAGDIGAAVGLKFTATGDTLCHATQPVVLERIRLPDPVISVAIEAKASADKDKMLKSLSVLEKEDPSCRLVQNNETGQTLLYGMGELHLEILVDRLRRENKVQLSVGKPQVSYREALGRAASARVCFEKELEGKKQFCAVELSLKPIDIHKALDIQGLDKFNGFKDSDEWKRAATRSLKQAAFVGPLAGYPLLGVHVQIQKLEARVGETSVQACSIATGQAFRQALQQAQCTLLEPVFELHITSPDEFVGAVVSDMTRREGHIHSTTVQGGLQLVEAQAPLRNLFGYATHLRSLSQGRAWFSMQLKTYAPAPASVMP